MENLLLEEYPAITTPIDAIEDTAKTKTKPVSGSANWIGPPIGITANPNSAEKGRIKGAMSQEGRSTPSGTMSSFASKRTASATMMSRPNGPSRLTAIRSVKTAVIFLFLHVLEPVPGNQDLLLLKVARKKRLTARMNSPLESWCIWSLF